MTSIFYERRDGEVYEVDEVSQRLLVYLYLHGDVDPEEVIDPVDAENEAAVHARISNRLNGNAADLVTTRPSSQQTLHGQSETILLTLTERGEEFVEKHRSKLSMPVDVAELAKKVAEIQIRDHMLDDLRARMDYLEELVQDSED